MAKTKTARRAGAKKGARQGGAAKKASRAASKRSTKKAAAKRSAKKAAPTKAAKRTASKTTNRPQAKKSAAPKTMGRGAARKTAPARPAAPARRPPTLDRQRRTVEEAELVPSPPSSLDLNRRASAARSGRAELADSLRKHTSTGPALTGGDIDADWESAESVGDEAPGGDNPTPDQDVVDEIGKALGVEYEDDEELLGGEEIVERDKNRWELDPASREDFEDE